MKTTLSIRHVFFEGLPEKFCQSVSLMGNIIRGDLALRTPALPRSQGLVFVSQLIRRKDHPFVTVRPQTCCTARTRDVPKGCLLNTS